MPVRRDRTLSILVPSIVLCAALASACHRAPPPLATAPAREAATAAKTPAASSFTPLTMEGQEPKATKPLSDVVAQLEAMARGGDLAGLPAQLTRASIRRLSKLQLPGGPLPVTAPTLLQRFDGQVTRVTFLGGRAILQVSKKGNLQTSYFYLEDGHWKLDLANSRPPSAPTPGLPDPLNLPLALSEATAGIPGTGNLVAVLDTSEGPLTCTLAEQIAPRTVANFVGLARGLRASLRVEGGKITNQWQHRPFYDELSFSRVVPDTLIEAGDVLGRGMGHAGYQLADEMDLRLRHDRPGVLSMAENGVNTGSSRFVVTARAMPDLDDRQTVFGACREAETIARISRMPAGNVVIRGIGFRRGE